VATEEQQKQNLMRMYKLMIQGLAKGLYDLFGESSYAVMHPVGDDLLEIMQKEMGLEIGGNNVTEMLTEVGRLFVDEFGFAERIEVVEASDNHAVVHVESELGYSFLSDLEKLGVEHPFTCPIMNVMSGAMRKNMQKSPQVKMEYRTDVHGSIITFNF